MRGKNKKRLFLLIVMFVGVALFTVVRSWQTIDRKDKKRTLFNIENHTIEKATIIRDGNEYNIIDLSGNPKVEIEGKIYPASSELISSLHKSLDPLIYVQVVTHSSDSHKKYELDNNNMLIVETSNARETFMVAPKGMMGSYVRLSSSDTVYVTDNLLSYIVYHLNPKETKLILAQTIEDVSAIAIYYKDELVLTKKDNAWSLEGGERVDKTAIEAYLHYVLNISAKDIVFGGDVEAFTDDKLLMARITVRIGEELHDIKLYGADSEEYYLKSSQEPAHIYVISKEMFEVLLQDKSSFLLT